MTSVAREPYLALISEGRLFSGKELSGTVLTSVNHPKSAESFGRGDINVQPTPSPVQRGAIFDSPLLLWKLDPRYTTAH